jgi:hypothetical protein
MSDPRWTLEAQGHFPTRCDAHGCPAMATRRYVGRCGGEVSRAYTCEAHAGLFEDQQRSLFGGTA